MVQALDITASWQFKLYKLADREDRSISLDEFVPKYQVLLPLDLPEILVTTTAPEPFLPQGEDFLEDIRAVLSSL